MTTTAHPAPATGLSTGTGRRRAKNIDLTSEAITTLRDWRDAGSEDLQGDSRLLVHLPRHLRARVPAPVREHLAHSRARRQGSETR